jgi:predicted transcriptional regulator
MAAVKISSKVDANLWRELKALARDSNQSISSLLTEAIREFLQRKRVRPVFLRHLENSMEENERLGRLLGE